ncbi:MAG TPA: PhzF family phenazine biosynthesis protein [Anaerolineae bacterium]|nr:PhzF family phenazine biosynthesis protein [Anaerolineae bacterium]
MEIPLYHVDAFTHEPFHGNPAADCLLAAPQDDDWLQAVAQEMNLSETAFLWPERGDYRLRWFTPTVEVELCGHGTLASAHVLWESGRLDPDKTAHFETLSGPLTAVRRPGMWVELNFPATPVEPAEDPGGLCAALGVTPLFIGRSCFDYLVEVEGEGIVRGLKPDFDRIRRVPARGVIVTSRAEETPGYDFVSRWFGPQTGVAEDPVTGSAHCALAPYWEGRLRKREFLAYQASRRGGQLMVRLEGERVAIAGQAVTVARGVLTERVASLDVDA